MEAAEAGEAEAAAEVVARMEAEKQRNEEGRRKWLEYASRSGARTL